jgi:hypothetical protein
MELLDHHVGVFAIHDPFDIAVFVSGLHREAVRVPPDPLVLLTSQRKNLGALEIGALADDLRQLPESPSRRSTEIGWSFGSKGRKEEPRR